MSQAEELLNGLDPEEVIVRSVNPTAEPHIVINHDRTITVPEELKHIAVQGDHNIETATFDCPRYWDGHDLSAMAVTIVYRRSDGYLDSHLAENIAPDALDDTLFHFDWTLFSNATAVPGTLSFFVCAKLTGTDGIRQREWHSRLNKDLIVDESMDCSNEEVITENPDIIESIIAQMDALEENCGGGGITITDDGNGNVAIYSNGSIPGTDDENGNVIIE